MNFVNINGRDIAGALYGGQYQYQTAEQIASNIKRDKGRSCTAEQVREIIHAYNDYGNCFDEVDLLGQKMYRAVHYKRWYPSKPNEVKNRKMNWPVERRRNGKLKCHDCFDRFYFDWLMDGGDFPILFQACYYCLDKMRDFQKLSTEDLIRKLSEWARETPEKISDDLDATVLACWKIRCVREQQDSSAASTELPVDYTSPLPPAYMTSREFIDRITHFIPTEIRFEKAYTILWAPPSVIDPLYSWFQKIARQSQNTKS